MQNVLVVAMNHIQYQCYMEHVVDNLISAHAALGIGIPDIRKYNHLSTIIASTIIDEVRYTYWGHDADRFRGMHVDKVIYLHGAESRRDLYDIQNFVYQYLKSRNPDLEVTWDTY